MFRGGRILDIDELLVPLSEEAPSGEDLEYDPAFGELERAAAGTPAQVMGDHESEAIPPDWRTVRDQSLELFQRTRDLRVAIHLSNALLSLEGLSGFRDGLKLIHGLSENLWDTVYPQLDEDDQDPIIRCNAVSELVSREKTLANVLDAPFVEARQAGRYSLRDIKIINGELNPPKSDDKQRASPELVEAAFREVEQETLESTHALIRECVEGIADIASLYDTKVGADAPDLAPLKGYLDEIAAFMNQQMSRLGIGEAVAEESWDDTPGESAGGAGGAAISGDIRTSADVLKMIDKICFYYEQREPSSPVPILLKRAATLVNKSFIDIVADLAPSGVSEVELYSPSPDRQSSDAGSSWATEATSEAQSSDDSDDSWD